MIKLTNFEAPNIEKLGSLLKNFDLDITEDIFREIAIPYNIGFAVENMSRLQTMLFVELKDSYVHQSQRYVKVDSSSFDKPYLEAEDSEKYDELVNKGMNLYHSMSELKVEKIRGRPKISDYKYEIPFEDARYILPVCAFSNISCAMNASKLWDLYKLLNSSEYGKLFAEMKVQLGGLLPDSLVQVLNRVPGKIFASETDFIYTEYFSSLNPENRIVQINSFEEPGTRVGLGALTSTQEKTMREVSVSYGDQLSEKALAVANRVISYGHTGVLEQTRHTFGLMMSVAAYHQHARHRLSMAHREALTNLVVSEDREACVPPTVASSSFREDFLEYYKEVKKFRKYLAEKYGSSTAFYLILNCDMIKMVMSSNARIDCDIMRDRLCQTAQWEIRNIYEQKFEILADKCPSLYRSAIPPCVTGVCKEGKMTCGRAEEMKEKYDRFLR